MSYEDDLDEIAWQEYERRLLFIENELCGYTADLTEAAENQGKEGELSSDKPDGVD